MKIMEMETPAGNKSTFHKIKINEYNENDFCEIHMIFDCC
jgi:hypothetical protein